MTTGLVTGTISATLASAIGVPSFAYATGSSFSWATVSRDVAVDEGAQARRELHRGQAELARRVLLQAHRVRRNAGQHRRRQVGDAGHLRDAVAEAQHLAFEDVGVGPEEGDVDLLVERHLDPGNRLQRSPDRLLDLFLAALALVRLDELDRQRRRVAQSAAGVADRGRDHPDLRHRPDRVLDLEQLVAAALQARADRQRDVEADVAVIALRDELGADERRDRDRDDEAGDAGEDDDRTRRDRRQAPAPRRG